MNSSHLTMPDLCIFEIIDFCDWRSRGCFSSSCRYLSTITSTEETWLHHLKLLHRENGIYFSPVKVNGESYKSMFFSNWNHRKLWLIPAPLPGDATTPTTTAGPSLFNITVCARFKPSKETTEESDSTSCKHKVTLPLHQRLQLIKLSKRLKSNAAALNVLKQEGSWFGAEWDKIDAENPEASSGDNKENSPSSPRRRAADASHVNVGIQSIDPMNGRVVMVEGGSRGLREFEFDSVLAEHSSQSLVYESAARKLVSEFMNTINGTLFCYGQTGSGKSFTMFGAEASFADRSSRSLKGLVPRVCEEVLQAMRVRETTLNDTILSSLSVSYIEIFGDEVVDLLQGGKRCGNSRVASQRYVLSGGAEKPLSSLEECVMYLNAGEQQKKRAATAMNDRSSRAHSLFILTLDQKNARTGVSAKSKLFLCDLGGSEQIKKSKVDVGSSEHLAHLKRTTLGGKIDDVVAEEGEAAEPVYSTGFKFSDRLREAVNINLGLLALKKVVQSLMNNSVPGNKKVYVPYQDSKLTMLLSTGLGGNSKCVVVVTAAKEPIHASETTAALRFGETCRKIEKSARSGANLLAEIIAQIDAKIKVCEDNIKKNERWEVLEEKRVDTLAEEGTMESLGFGGVEVKKVTVLVGAEKDRAELSVLLKKRAELTGTTLDSEFGGDKYGGAVGFGAKKGMAAEAYGFGEAGADDNNYRFEDVKAEELPEVLKGKVAGWSATQESAGQLEKFAKKANRRKMAYAGISA